MAGNSKKIGPMSERAGSALYPGFYPTVPQGFGRIQRLEKGSQRSQRGGLKPTAGNFTRLPINLLKGNSQGYQNIPLSQGGIRKIGGVSPSVNTAGFAYTSTTSSITWYWDGTNGSKVPVITRADGSRFTVPTAGSGLTISGLANSTDYYFLPFWNTNNTCNIGWVPGTIGSPQIAFVLADTTDITNGPVYVMMQSYQGNEPLTAGYMKATTGGGGGSGGGGGAHCVMAGTDIVPLGDLSYVIEVHSETEWVHLRIEDGRELYCTFDHPLYHAFKGKVMADSLTEGDIVITDVGLQAIVTAEYHRRVCSKHKVRMAKGHLFWANGFLSNNMKIFSG